MSNETQVKWEKESDARLAHLLGGVPNSVMHTIKNDQEVRKALDNSKGVFFKVESERLYAELEDGTKLTKGTNFPNVPDATIIASKNEFKQVSLVFDKLTTEQLKQRQKDKGRSR